MAALLVLVTAIAGCASGESLTRRSGSEVPQAMRSGFLEDYALLQPVADEPGITRWFADDVDWEQFDRFLVDPVEFRVPPSYQDDLYPRPEVVVAVTEYFRQALTRELGAKYQIVDEPGIGVVRISGAITAVVPADRELDGWQYIPIATIATGVSDATGIRGKDLVVFMEGQLSDTLNGKLLAEVLQSRVSTQAGAGGAVELKPRDLKPVLDYWAGELPLQIEQQRVAAE